MVNGITPSFRPHETCTGYFLTGTQWLNGLSLAVNRELRTGGVNDYQPVIGQFPVVGVWQNGLIIEQDGQLRAVGASQARHNLYPLKARLIAGEPLRVMAERVDMAGHTLRWLVSRIDQSRPYYLLGEVEMADGRGPARVGRLDSVDSFNPASYRGGILQLHYARAQELGPWLDLVAVRGEVVVQFWLRPGEAAVTLGVGEGQREEQIPSQLKRFF